METIITIFRKPNRWNNKSSSRSSFFLIFTFLTSLIFLYFFISYNPFSTSLLPFSTISHFPHCHHTTLGPKFFMYAPHSGFTNQLSEFKNAILMAAILNRTLIVPPVLDHHAVALGSCPKFRVLSPNQLRISVWNHIVELIKGLRYVSMADVIDVSTLVSDSAVRIIDFRDFMSK